MKIAVVGVTGMVGQVMLQVLAEHNIEIDQLIPVASEKSVGKSVVFKGQSLPIISIAKAVEAKPDFALFSAGSDVSKIWAPKFAEVGTTVVDNSSAWRMDPNIKLVIPEVNADLLTDEDKIIANPNCSTIQLALTLKPLHQRYQIKRVIVSTYQSITGSGVKALRQLENEEKGEKGKMAYPYPIHHNALPHCDVFLENDYTKEEMKLTHETKKILGDDSIKVVATAIRIPVVGGHSESVNIEFENDFKIRDIRQILRNFKGIAVKDNPDMNMYPMPLFAQGKDDVFVGRIRKDFTQANSLNLWIVADNLRKGAATNAVQIVEYLIKKEKYKSYKKLDLKH